MKNSANDCNRLIDGLNTSKEIKDALRKIFYVASSENSKMKQSIKNLFIVSPTCKELSKIGKSYERIITSNDVYSTRGSRTYLELAFPASDNQSDYKEFFASPQIAAATQNYFSGVFLISFELWKSANELLKDKVFDDLISFIDSNKNNMKFVFHVTPEFNDASYLETELEKILNIYSLKHLYPDVGEAFKYIEKKLNEAGIVLDSDAKFQLKEILYEIKHVGSGLSYFDYRTLDKIAANLQFELYVNSEDKREDLKFCVIQKKDIAMIASKIMMPEAEKSICRKVGFM